jgi:hypothetical protein
MEAVPAKTEKTRLRRENAIYFAPSVRNNPDRLKVIRTFLSWRYGLTNEVDSIQSASVIVGQVSAEVGHAVVLPDTNIRELRIVGDEKLKVVNWRPKVLAPFVEHSVKEKLALMVEVLDDKEIETPWLKHAFASTMIQKRQLELELRKAILARIDLPDYIVLDELLPHLHVAIAALASSKGKYVIAVCSNPVMAAFADYPVSRKEDIVAAVASVIGHE